MKEYCQAIIEQFDDNDICKKCNRPYGEHYGLECPKEGTVIIKRDLIKEALSANNEKWEEKIKVIHSNIQKRLENGGSPIVVLATVKADIDSLLSQMKEGK